MSGSTVRISKESHDTLREIAARDRKSLQAILDAAIEDYRRHRFLQEVNNAYSELRKTPKTWKAEMEERKQWDVPLSDSQMD